MIEKFQFTNSFKIDANVKNAKITYIVDPYDRSKDIICYTPCRILIPWEPQRARANKAKVLVEKEGYIPQVVELTKRKSTIIWFLIIAIVVGPLGAIISHKFEIPGYTLAIFLILGIVNFSTGSGDLYIKLKSTYEDKKLND